MLILVERGAVAKNSALLKAAGRYGKVEEYLTPKGASFERWISEHARALDVKVTPGALSLLSTSLPDLASASNELETFAICRQGRHHRRARPENNELDREGR